jgi:hypothetical protein
VLRGRVRVQAGRWPAVVHALIRRRTPTTAGVVQWYAAPDNVVSLERVRVQRARLRVQDVASTPVPTQPTVARVVLHVRQDRPAPLGVVCAQQAKRCAALAALRSRVTTPIVVRVAPYALPPIRARWVRVPACVPWGSHAVVRPALICKPVRPIVACAVGRVLRAQHAPRVCVRL